MATQLDQLKAITTVVADTGDIEAIRTFKPVDATTNPSLLLKAAGIAEYQPLLTSAKEWAQRQSGDSQSLLSNMTDRFAVEIGREILKIIPGRISTEVDARLSFDTTATINQARKLIAMYEELGIGRERILIKIASTWEGISAAKTLEQEGVNCNLTLLFSFTQAVACADAGAYLISPFVGRILDWHKESTPDADLSGPADPGVQSVSKIYNHYKASGYNTIVMGASFRNIEEIRQLAGCDRLTIAPTLMQELQQCELPLQRMLNPEQGSISQEPPLSEGQFRWGMNEDPMATEKLAEGIRKFAEDQIKLEQLLSKPQ